jgi:16S rRNA (uracil1498-N3)-methyltransferase
VRRVLAPALARPGGTLDLPVAESHHLLEVIRLARGERVQVADGAGRVAVARIEGVVEGRARLLVEELRDAPPLPERVVLLGVPKPALLEEALTLGTEAGASRFVLVEARRSPPGRLRAERCERILRAAVTQCGRATVPVITEPTELGAALVDLPGAPARWLCEAGGEPPAPTRDDLVIAIGPEGGWDPAEADLLALHGFARVTLGPHTLRTPTAVAAGLSRSW